MERTSGTWLTVPLMAFCMAVYCSSPTRAEYCTASDSQSWRRASSFGASASGKMANSESATSSRLTVSATMPRLMRMAGLIGAGLSGASARVRGDSRRSVSARAVCHWYPCKPRAGPRLTGHRHSVGRAPVELEGSGLVSFRAVRIGGGSVRVSQGVEHAGDAGFRLVHVRFGVVGARVATGGPGGVQDGERVEAPP